MGRQFSTTYGPGDPQTWGFRQPDDDDDSGETWYEQAARLIEEAREELAIAENAAMHRDEEKFRVAMLNAKEVIRELWND
jgi:hypothetical protein